MNRAITAIAIAVVFVGGMFFAGVPVEAKKGGGGNDVQPGILDIKPGSCPNPINLGSNGVTLVAILGSDTLDVNDIVLSANQETWKPRIEDVGSPFQGEFNDKFSCIEGSPDGFDDLTLKIPVSALQGLCPFGDGTTVLLGIILTLEDGTSGPVFDVITTIQKNKACV